MANKHLKKEPHNIDNNAWWYEKPDGIKIIIPTDHGNKPKEIRISWRDLRNALARKDKKNKHYESLGYAEQKDLAQSGP